MLPLFDPPREQARATIASARQMGVTVKMVTGDQLAIAKETARQLGMGTNILDASGLGDTKHHETAQSAAAIENADGFAQVFPEHKFHIVDVLQQRGHIVGMTGDGVNDAPALKKADCGIAVSGATDAARAAASIVLLASGLSVIIDAIKESRRIFQRMNSYAIYRIAETLRVLLFMTLSILVFNFYPVTAVMIVMLALLNDGAILSIAYDNVHYKDKPEAWNMRLVLGISTVLGVIGVVAAFGLFYLGRASLSSRPPPHPDLDVPEAIGGRSSDDFPYAHARTILVDTPSEDSVDRRSRHPDDGDPDCSLRIVYEASWMEVGRIRLGLRFGLVSYQRPRETARLPDPGPNQTRIADQEADRPELRDCCTCLRTLPAACPGRKPAGSGLARGRARGTGRPATPWRTCCGVLMSFTTRGKATRGTAFDPQTDGEITFKGQRNRNREEPSE